MEWTVSVDSTIGSDLGFPGQTQQLVVSAYVVFAGGFLLLGGRAADLFGRRRVFVLALTLYAVSSLAGGLAESPAVIIAARAVQGIGGALLLPSTLSLINTLFDEGPKRNRALAVWGGAGASGLTVGALAALAVIPRDAQRTEKRKFDLPGALTANGGSTLLVFALVQGPERGWADAVVIATFAVAVILLGASRRSRCAARIR